MWWRWWTHQVTVPEWAAETPQVLGLVGSRQVVSATRWFRERVAARRQFAPGTVVKIAAARNESDAAPWPA